MKGFSEKLCKTLKIRALVREHWMLSVILTVTNHQSQ